jgi:hypothetical protein
VERALIRPPQARVGPLTPQERQMVIASSPMRGRYERAVDGESAYEILMRRRQLAQAEAGAPVSKPGPGGTAPAPQEASSGGDIFGSILGSILGGGSGGTRRGRMTVTERVINNAASSAARTVGNQLGKAILRGVLGSLK